MGDSANAWWYQDAVGTPPASPPASQPDPEDYTIYSVEYDAEVDRQQGGQQGVGVVHTADVEEEDEEEVEVVQPPTVAGPDTIDLADSEEEGQEQEQEQGHEPEEEAPDQEVGDQQQGEVDEAEVDEEEVDWHDSGDDEVDQQQEDAEDDEQQQQQQGDLPEDADAEDSDDHECSQSIFDDVTLKGVKRPTSPLSKVDGDQFGMDDSDCGDGEFQPSSTSHKRIRLAHDSEGEDGVGPIAIEPAEKLGGAGVAAPAMVGRANSSAPEPLAPPGPLSPPWSPATTHQELEARIDAVREAKNWADHLVENGPTHFTIVESTFSSAIRQLGRDAAALWRGTPKVQHAMVRFGNPSAKEDLDALTFPGDRQYAACTGCKLAFLWKGALRMCPYARQAAHTAEGKRPAGRRTHDAEGMNVCAGCNAMGGQDLPVGMDTFYRPTSDYTKVMIQTARQGLLHYATGDPLASDAGYFTRAAKERQIGSLPGAFLVHVYLQSAAAVSNSAPIPPSIQCCKAGCTSMLKWNEMMSDQFNKGWMVARKSCARKEREPLRW
jgi:hypothetical protein